MRRTICTLSILFLAVTGNGQLVKNLKILFHCSQEQPAKQYDLLVFCSKFQMIMVDNSTNDTTVYMTRSWKKLKNNDYLPVSAMAPLLRKTEEKKKILNYSCTKFLGEYPYGVKLTVWASDELPSTLLLYPGMEEFGYGILEIKNESDNSTIVAAKIDIL